MTADRDALSCPICRAAFTPGRHIVDPLEGRTDLADLTPADLDRLEPYYVECPNKAATRAAEDAAVAAKKHTMDESTRSFKAAKEIVADASLRLSVFSANDLRQELDAAQIPGPIVGAAFSWAQREGLIEAAGMVPSTDGPTHGHRIFRWRSLRRAS